MLLSIVTAMSGGQLNSWLRSSVSKSKASAQTCTYACRLSLWKTDLSWSLVANRWWLSGQPKGCLCFGVSLPGLVCLSSSSLSCWSTWTQGGTLDFPCQWRKTGFSRARSSGFCIKLASGAHLLHVVLAEAGPREHLQSIWHGEQLSCTKQVSTECQQKMRRMTGNFSISGVIPYSFVRWRMQSNGA